MGKIGLKVLVRPAKVADVRVRVDETRSDAEPARVEDFGFFPARVRRARPDVADSAVEHGDLHPVENFPGINVDELAAGDDQIGLDLAQRPAHQSFDLLL